MSLLVPLLCLQAYAGGESFIRFNNGDRLTGVPESIDKEQVVWNSPLIERPVPFPIARILDLSMPSQAPAANAADHEAVVTLTKEEKGGVIRGQLSDVTDDAVVIDTWFAGPMRFNRRMVKSVHIEPSSSLRYRGPNSIEGWTVNPKNDAWVYSNFSFLCKGSGSIARDDLLPDECSIAFDVEWNADSASYKVVVFSDSADTRDPQSGYEFSIQRGGMILRNLRTQSYMGNANSHEIFQSNRAHIEIKASRRTGKIAWYVNEKLVDMWTDNDVERGQLGKGLHFITLRAVPLRISKIRITDWNGNIDEPIPPRVGLRRIPMGIGPNDLPKPEPDKDKEEDGRMKLANGDSIDGKVKSIQQGKVTVETPLGELTLPVARLRTIMLPAGDKEEAKAENRDVRAWMADGGFIVFEFLDADEDTITGKSQTFGTATFRRNAFQKIEFNIHDWELDSLRNEAAW